MSRKRNYFNTTHLEGQELIEAIEGATEQDLKTYLYFLNNPDKLITSYDVLYDALKSSPMPPLSSACRSINTLFNNDLLVKTGHTTIAGPYNKKCVLWRLKTPADRQTSLLDLPGVAK